MLTIILDSKEEDVRCVWEVHYTDFHGRRQVDVVNSERAALNVYRNYQGCYGDVRAFRLETHCIEEAWCG